ncbi:7983_t:CDS:2, partial [Ambispora gerdemannii]
MTRKNSRTAIQIGESDDNILDKNEKLCSCVIAQSPDGKLLVKYKKTSGKLVFWSINDSGAISMQDEIEIPLLEPNSQNNDGSHEYSLAISNTVDNTTYVLLSYFEKSKILYDYEFNKRTVSQIKFNSASTPEAQLFEDIESNKTYCIAIKNFESKKASASLQFSGVVKIFQNLDTVILNSNGFIRFNLKELENTTGLFQRFISGDLFRFNLKNHKNPDHIVKGFLQRLDTGVFIRSNLENLSLKSNEFYIYPLPLEMDIKYIKHEKDPDQ